MVLSAWSVHRNCTASRGVFCYLDCIPGYPAQTEKPLGAIHSTKIQTGPTGKRGPPQKVDQFFETFPVGPNRSIEFWTEISGNFG